jgi:subtilase family serine protease
MIAASASAQRSAPRIRGEINSAEQSTLRNSLHPMARLEFDSGRLAAATPLSGITMVFNRSAAQEAALKQLIADQQNPASPGYHQWLTPDEFAAQFGMADADLSKAQGWLEQQGFSIDSVARSKNAIHFSGTARQVEQAFSTEMHVYKINGTQHFAPSTELSVPSALAPAVLAIKNLDDFRPKSHVVLNRNRVRPGFTTEFTSSQSGNVYFAPGDIATVYDIKPLYNSGITGAGESITLVGQSAIQTSDIEAFESAVGLTAKDPTQFLVPNSGNSTIYADGDESESDLDIEWSGAIAPGATINFVYVGNSLNYSAFDSIVYAIDEKIGTIVSSSYGECEAELPSTTLGSGSALEPTLESALEQGTAQGQTFIAAAGDEGSTDCYGTNGLTTAQQEALAVDYPGSSAYVTSMGGTEISGANSAYDISGTAYWAAANSADVVSSALQYIPEVVWNDDAANCGASSCLSAGGGGASSLFSKPSWQTGVPGIPSDGKRDVPDLALYASPSFPGFLYCTSDASVWASGQSGSCAAGFRDSNDVDLTVAGGTSFDGPIFAGILALISEKQGYTTGQGLVNSTLYNLASNSATYTSAFHDITSGNNDCDAGSANCNGTIGFSAGAGYDQASGLGSLDVSNLAGAWPASASTAPTLIATTTTITASNSTPNVNANDTFTVTVTGASGTPTGSVTLTVDSNAPITETLSANGTFVYTTSFATVGSHTVLAAYVADSTYAASTGSVIVNVAAVSSGTGTIALAATPSTLTVTQGSSGNETITVTPAGGYTGTVGLTFDTSNDSALQNLCWEWSNQNSAGNGTVSITGKTAVTSTLTLDANASDCATAAAVQTTGKHPFKAMRPLVLTSNTAKNTGRNPVPLAVAFAGLLLVGFMGRSSRKLRGLAAILLLAAVGLVVTACGGIQNNALSNPPAGSYTITVTGQDSATATITGTTTFTFVISN